MMAHSRILWNALCAGLLVWAGGCGELDAPIEDTLGWSGEAVPQQTDVPESTAPTPAETEAAKIKDLLEELTVPIDPYAAGEFEGNVFGRVEVATPVRENPKAIRVGLLLPTGAGQPELARIAADMHNAAELAMFSLNMEEIVLLPFDTKGTPAGASAAMRRAMNSQVDIVLGPLLASEVSAISPLAGQRGVTVIAFSNDSSSQEDNVLLLNFSPEQDIERILSFAYDRGIQDYAALLPNTPYGRRVESILRRHVLTTSSTLHRVEHYERVIDGPYEPARKLGALIGEPVVEEGEEQQSPSPFDAVLLADNGQILQIAASALAYFDIAPPNVQLLGTHLWDNSETFNEPALQHGWYPAARSKDSELFSNRYEEIYGAAPDRLAGLAYDAMSLVGLLVREGDSWRSEKAPPNVLLRPGGFAGVQGLFRFLPNGRSERSLAIWEIEEGNAVLLQEPDAFFSGGG
ncbi:MAG: penicillin-binding protein activator [Hyphomicrobiales bacterium]|nr:penicillin-binding protein activator [Hyphomicrobiales bacterium]MCY4049199.1 penicillin-binding protein activator [Hyphomicrobiales bacterium]MCY4053053.1 penicillin-binding protein activator [Hyphomicrobiales bacterium]